MPRYLIDVNLPYYFSLWNSADYIHQIDIDPKAKDKDIWNYARGQNLIIITKDSDFSNRVLLSIPPPKVVHVRIGNKSMKEFYRIIDKCWQEVLHLIETHKLVTIYENQIEGVN